MGELDNNRGFRRMYDNTVYHKGYPVCFRGRPGVPAIKMPATNDKARADVDVDYRSKSFSKGTDEGSPSGFELHYTSWGTGRWGGAAWLAEPHDGGGSGVPEPDRLANRHCGLARCGVRRRRTIRQPVPAVFSPLARGRFFSAM
jgi:hypothetical protein